MKALILVGGFGTRLRPLTLSVPKPSVEFVNKQMILHQIEALAAIGVTEVVLAVNYKPELMAAKLDPEVKKLGIKVTYSRETEPMGTAGPLALAREILDDGTGQPFFVLNSDIISEYPFKDLLDFHKKHSKEGTIYVTKVEEPSKYGVVIYGEDGKITKFVEKPAEFVSNRINAGLYIFNPSILKRIQLKPTSIEREIFPKMALDGELYAMDLRGYWMDIGQPPDYLIGMALHLNFLASKNDPSLAKGTHIHGPVIIDPSAKIGEGCCFGPNVVIGPNVVVGDGVRLMNTTVLSGAVIKNHCWVNKSIIGWECVIGNWVRMENDTVLGEDVTVADEIYVNGAKVLPHKAISENISEPTVIL